MPAVTGTKFVKICENHLTDCVCEGYQPPWGGVGPDAALLLVPVAPGRGQSAPMCVICALLAMTMMTLSTSSCHDVPGHVTPTSLRSLFIPCQNFSVHRSDWGHHFFPGAVRCFPGFPFKINFLSLGPPSRTRFGKTKLILLSQQDQLGHAGDDQDQGLLWAPVRGVKEQGQ